MVGDSRSRLLVEVEDLLEQATAPILLLARVVLVLAARSRRGGALAADFSHEILVIIGDATGEAALVFKDAVQLSTVEPDTATCWAGVDRYLAAVDFDKTRAARGALHRLTGSAGHDPSLSVACDGPPLGGYPSRCIVRGSSSGCV